MNEIHIDVAGFSDIGTLLAFMERFYAIDGYPFDGSRARGSVSEFIADPHRGTIWLAKDRDRPIGYIVLAIVYSFEFGGKNAFVDEFYLEEEYRGQGVGRRMMEHCVAEAKRMNIEALHLEAEVHNAAAIELYRSLRFNDHHRILMTRMLNDDGQNLHR